MQFGFRECFRRIRKRAMRAVNEGKPLKAMTKHSRYKCHTTQEAIKIKCAGDFTKQCSESQENKVEKK